MGAHELPDGLYLSLSDEKMISDICHEVRRISETTRIVVNLKPGMKLKRKKEINLSRAALRSMRKMGSDMTLVVPGLSPRHAENESIEAVVYTVPGDVALLAPAAATLQLAAEILQ